MEPPGNSEIRDDDRGDEDFVAMNNLSGNQLRENAEINFLEKSNVDLDKSDSKHI